MQALSHDGGARPESLDVSYSGRSLDSRQSQGLMSSLTQDMLTTLQHLKLPWECCLGAASDWHINVKVQDKTALC